MPLRNCGGERCPSARRKRARGRSAKRPREMRRSCSQSRDRAPRAFSKRMTLAACASNIKCPLYIVGGGLDRLVPPEESEKMAKAASGPVVMNMIEDGTHVANNRIYKYRTQSADWMAAQLAK